MRGSTWHRIKRHVRPYGGKLFEELRGTEGTAIGWVHVSPAKIATGQRMYYRHELVEDTPPA